MKPEFFKGKRVFITGHSGFKGAWLYTWLRLLGAEVAGYSLPPETNPSLFALLYPNPPQNSTFGDILDARALEGAMLKFSPEIVFHLAAQPIVRRSYSEPVNTYAVNVMGTLNVLETARKAGTVKAFVNITTDKCYENRETGKPFVETDPMGGYDMYSSSKACSEILSASYRRSFLGKSYALATARAGNVIGGGDWAADRLVPDCMRAIAAGKPVEIRSPASVRPWQHVLEPLGGYMLLAQKLFERGAEFADAFNFGPEPDSFLRVDEVVRQIISSYGAGEMLVRQSDSLHEASLLRLDISKAKSVLGWKPAFSPQRAISETAAWYKAFYEGEDPEKTIIAQIQNFQNLTADE